MTKRVREDSRRSPIKDDWANPLAGEKERGAGNGQ